MYTLLKKLTVTNLPKTMPRAANNNGAEEFLSEIFELDDWLYRRHDRNFCETIDQDGGKK